MNLPMLEVTRTKRHRHKMLIEDITETARLQRDPEFLQTIRDAYDECCVVCGVRRGTPDGHPEVEAAHIKPVSDGAQTR